MTTTATDQTIQKDMTSSSPGKVTSEERWRLEWEADRQARQKAQAERMRDCLGKRFKKRRFETFTQPGNEEALEKCKDYIDNKTYETEDRNSLLLVGKPGTGKTHLAAAISNEIIDSGIPVMFDTFSGYLGRLQAEFASGQRVLQDKMSTAPILVIDDIGKEKSTEWSRSVMFEVINKRYEDCLPVILTSNIYGRELEEYLGEALYSRLCEMCRGIQTTGNDIRRII